MASKLQLVTEFSYQKTMELTAVRGNWQQYLKTAARIYKYPFRDQILIHAQRPDATACATIEFWNKKMDRWVNKGTRGIALLDDSGPKTRLKYVFDVSDTHPGRYHPKEPRLWQMQSVYEEAVLESIGNSFEVERNTGTSFVEQVCSMSQMIAEDNLTDYLEELRSVSKDSFLEDLDDLNLSVRLKTLLANSIAYTVLSRCGYDADQYFDEVDFEFIHDFSTYETVSVLGNAANSISKMLLLDIGRTIDQQERTSKFAKQQNFVYDGTAKEQSQMPRKENKHYDQRTDLHSGRGLSVSRSVPAGNRGGHSDGQVRNVAQDLSEEEQTDVVRSAAAGGQTGQPSDGHRPESDQDGGTDDQGDGTGQRGGRDDEGQQSDGMGTGHEQLQSIGGGSGASTADLQLSESEQIHILQTEAENVLPTSSAFFVGQQVVDQFLRYGGNTDNLRLRVVSLFQIGMPQPQIAARLQMLYHGGTGITTEKGRMTAWYGEDGIHLAYGDRARYEANAQVIPWESAAQRIGELLEAGQFASNVELIEAEGHERKLLAQSLIYLHRDLNREDHRTDPLPTLNRDARWLSFPEDESRISNSLADPDFRKNLLVEYRAFLTAYQEDRSIMRFHYHDFHGILNRLEELDLPRKTFTTTMAELPAIMPFITEDEIDEELSSGSGFSGGAKRIYRFFQEQHDPKEKVDFLRKEYGTGGHTHALSRASSSSEDHDSKGIQYTKKDCPVVNLSWQKVSRRIEDLVRKDRYLTSEALAEYEADLASREVPEGQEPAPMQYNAVKERHPDHVVLFQFGDFFETYGEDAKVIAPELGLSLTTRPVPGVGRVEMCGIPAHRLEQYTNRLRRTHDILISTVPEGETERRELAMQKFSSPCRYQIPLGSTVYIGTKRYEMQSVEEDTVTLYDPEFPLLTQEFSRADFDLKLEENPLNELYFLPYEEPKVESSQKLEEQQAEKNDAKEDWEQVDGTQIREKLERSGIVNGQLVDEDKLAEQPFVQQVMADAERIAEESEHPTHSTETVSVYPAEENNLPYDIVVERLKVEPSVQTNEEYAKVNLIPGVTEFEQDGRRYRVDSVDIAMDKVELTDLSLAQSAGFPISRVESIETIRAYLETPALEEPPREPKSSRTAILSNVLHPEQADRHDHRITEDALGVGTPSERYQNNIAAIRLLKQLENEDRLATPEEQEILARYVGWGGLADCFEETNRNYLELKNLLTPEEYEAARESTLTAFYTPPVVIRSMYQTLEQMGFETGNVLEPSCGTGNFLGMMPERMSSSKRYGIELDEISGRIAQQLYQTASITIKGYEKTDLPDSFFDVAVGNIPFGNFKVADRRYDKHNFLIHDYFFGKTLDKVRPGGIIAFVTSKGTLDKENPAVRKYIAQRADLLGAIRLPNNTFKGAAGTEVTSDIMFLQKRDSIIDIEPDWVHLGVNENGIKMNQYFIGHPEMILGEMKEISGPYGPETACIPFEGQELSELLTSAIGNIGGSIWEYEREEGDEMEEDRSIPADPTVKNFSYTIVDGDVYYRENSRMNPVEVSTTALGRIKGLIGLRDCVKQLIEYQTEDYPEHLITEEQQKLNGLYDAFVKKYGRIFQRANNSAFHSDNSYFLLTSLEVTDSDGNFIRKADMFTKRTIKQKINVSRVDTASEALTLSLAEKACIDIPYMMNLTGKDEAVLVEELRGVMFRLPETMGENGEPIYVTADEYLSGNVRQKLRQAEQVAETDEQFRANVEALKAVQPVDLTASEISVRLGATWLPPEDVARFIFELFDTPNYARFSIKVHYSKLTGAWNIEGKSADRSSVKANSTYGTTRINGYKIIEETLNLKDVRIFDYVEDADGRKTAVLNKKETAIAQSKQQLIKQAFVDWIWKDPERRERLCKLYNEAFNSVRPREYDGSHLNFVGINPEITLRRHQVNAIAHILYGGNTLLAHVVGAGKTFEIVAAAQESKRLGLCNKSLIAVPNHLTEQWATEYLQLYPSANILVATKKDFEPKNRKKFCGRIATGDYDAIIIGHSQLEKIPMSIERQRAILEEQLGEVLDGIRDLKQSRGDNFSIKQMERTKKMLKAKLDKLNDQSRKDDVVTFEELGVDRLFVDEAHNYKNLAAYTKMRNVGGISQTEAQKSSDLYMKCRYLDELTGGRGVIFATGTPISNSMVEMYTMQKYLQHDELKGNDLLHFDAWASTFGETVTAIELAPEGTGYRAKTRFAKFYNLPELMSMFKEVADIQTADMLNLPVPKANYHHVVLKPSEQQKEMVAGLSERAERVRNKMVDSSVDNMLLITNDGRKLALDQRLINPLLPDSETGKVSACADNIYQIWQRTSSQKSTQLAFCDLSTPKSDGTFNVYDDLRDKLIAKGIPAEEIAYIHNANTEQQKKELFSKVCNGQVRVLLGSTAKMGAGTNVQQKLVALHHLDCPWRPADLQQREGRIIRQGNENKEVEIYTYVTENTFDSYLYQLVESKQKFIGQIMTSKSPVRSAEDIDETALSYAEIKALCTGNPYIKEKMDLDIDVGRLKLLKANHLSQKYNLEDQILKTFPQSIASLEQRIVGYQKDMAHLSQETKPNADGFSSMVIYDKEYGEKKSAGTAILEACKSMTNPEPIVIGTYRGFSMELSFDTFRREYQLALCHELRHKVTLGTDIYGNIQRMDNALDGLESHLEDYRQVLNDTKAQLETAQKEVEKPFAQEEELATKSARLEELNALLNMDQRDNELTEPSTEEVAEQNDRRTMPRSRGIAR